MITHHLIQSPDQQQSLLQDLASQKLRFIVADLETKFWTQQLLRQWRGGLVCSDDVLRASELWSLLLQRVDASWQVLPQQIAPFVLEQKMIQVLKETSLSISSQDSQRLYQTMGQILPLLSHNEGEEIIESWFQDNTEAQTRWYDWYQMSRFAWQDLYEKRSLPLEWMKAVLINQATLLFDGEGFVFDLGLDLDDVESELIINMGRQVHIEVLIPAMYATKDVYQNIINLSAPGEERKTVSLSKKTKFLKLPSQLGEVKQVTAQVRLWLDQGIPAQEIAVISPQIENYWPTLSEYFLVEGVPFAKNRVTPLSQIPSCQNWLAKVRLALEQMESVDAEQVVYGNQQTPSLSHQDFRIFYSHIYEKKDLLRGEKIKEFVPESQDPLRSLTLDEFLVWSLDLIGQGDREQIYKILEDLDDVLSLSMTLNSRQWLRFFERHIARSEKKILNGQENGICFLDPSQSLSRRFQKIFLLGLSEKALSENQDTALLWKDVESIRYHFGFNLPHADQLRGEDRLQWLEQKSPDEIVYSYSETDFSGQFQAPSFYWLQGALQVQHSLELDTPLMTRWDELMRQIGERGQNQFHQTTLEKVDSDLGRRSFHDSVMYEKLSLSASKFEEYFKCPFRFHAKVGLKLSSLPSLDLDVDSMTRGRLMHKVCEEIVKNELFALNVMQIGELVDQCRDDIEMEIYSDEMWQFVRTQYIELTQKFLRFENQWRQDYPHTYTYALEEPIRAFVDRDSQGLFFSKDVGRPFRGVIDRIDHNKADELLVLDYKSSANHLFQYSSWLRKGNLQLIVYALALQDGVLDQPQNVVGAYYYILKDQDRSKGMGRKDADTQFLGQGKMNKNDFEQFLTEGRALLGDLMGSLSAGEYLPQPADIKHCERCDWKTICRHPNLNL